MVNVKNKRSMLSKLGFRAHPRYKNPKSKENAGEKTDEIKCCQNCPGRFSEGRSGECGIILR